MLFTNITTKSVSEKDFCLMRNAVITLRVLLSINMKMVVTNKNWKYPGFDCHSVARFMSIIMTNCRLIDGYIIGLNKEGDKYVSVTTNHSWITTPDNAIIDPYPMGVISTGSVILMPSNENIYNVHGSNLYVPDPVASRSRFSESDSWKNAFSYKRTIKKYSDDTMIKQATSGLALI
jgi:hypothetical protein